MANPFSSKDLNQEVSTELSAIQKHPKVMEKKITDDSDSDLFGRVMQWFH